jgi:hypothetical protein
MTDINGKKLTDKCVVDIHQTVNGRSLFYVKTVSPLDVRYDYDRRRKYEYDARGLFAPCRFSGEVDWEIV